MDGNGAERYGERADMYRRREDGNDVHQQSQQEGESCRAEIQFSAHYFANENADDIPKFPPAFAANMGLETVVDGKQEKTAIPVMNSLIESGAN
jgi:hypothetical protein